MAKRVKTEKAEIKSVTNKKFADRYVNENYFRLADKFRVMDDQLNQKAISSLDKLNDTIISLYEHDKTFKSYGAFYKWANVKFIARNKRPKQTEEVQTGGDPDDQDQPDPSRQRGSDVDPDEIEID